jgi:MFS transporter, Spinster family, sphingosine-1-phosphate transporter
MDQSRVKTPRTYLLALLTVIMVFNYVDRVAMGLMLQDIKLDLALSDTQLGFLTGIAFAIFYAGMGIPIARWADRGNRVTIISLTVALWSAAVALCGAATSFLQMLFIRTGVAVGEAGCHPPAFSLIADYFPRSERPRAVARYMLGWPLALLLGYFAAGWLNEFYGWRTTFVIIGVPGIVLAALAAFTLQEPRRKAAVVTSPAPQPSLKEVFATLWASAAYRHLLFCFSLSYFFGNGILQWQPAFFVRSHTLQSGELGTWFAVVYGVGGLLGTWIGGELAARYAANNERRQLAGLAALYAALAIVGAAVYLAPDYELAFVVLALSAIGSAAVNGPLFAATQTLVPARMRAMSIALVLFFSNLIGLGLGPLAVGALSDALRPWLAEDSLRYALLAMCPGYFWCTWHLWRASRTVARDMAAATNTEAAASDVGRITPAQ